MSETWIDTRGTPLNELSATDLLRSYANGAKPSAAVAACLDRIEQREAQVGAWAALNPEAVRAAALACEGAHEHGALHGILVGIKDVIDTADMPTSYGSALYEGHRPAQDAEVVQLLRAAGAIIAGKTVSTEFAYFSAGKTSNPVDLARTPGGSSSGSAAAVGDRMVPLALGTQTAGSTIRPASFCGAFAFKPTYGLVSMQGVRPLAHSLDTIGLFARCVSDLALLASVLSRGAIQPNLKVSTGRPRIGLVSPRCFAGVEPSITALFERLAQSLRADADVSWLEQAFDVQALCAAQDGIMAVEAWQHHRAEISLHRASISAAFLALADRGAATPADAYSRFVALTAEARSAFDRHFENVDFLVMPSALGEAPLKSEGTGDPVCCRPLTLLGNPCIAVPSGSGPHGLPIGIQVVGRRGADDEVLSWAQWLSWRLSATS